MSGNWSTKVQAVVTVLMDTMLALDILNSSCFVFNTKLSGNMLLLTLSLLRTVLLLLPVVSRMTMRFYEPVARVAVISGARSIWQSPYSLKPIEKIEDLGPEFNLESLVEKFSLVWLQCE